MISQYSEHNILLVERALAERNKCSCHPTSGTVKTYRGWMDGGRQVKKGEKHLVQVLTFIPVSSTKQDVGEPTSSTRKRPWTASLFCYCQTRPTN